MTERCFVQRTLGRVPERTSGDSSDSRSQLGCGFERSNTTFLSRSYFSTGKTLVSARFAT